MFRLTPHIGIYLQSEFVMKTQEELQAAVAALRDVCKRHGVVMVATDQENGTYGEITLLDARECSVEWTEIRSTPLNVLHVPARGDFYTDAHLDGIGDFVDSDDRPTTWAPFGTILIWLMVAIIAGYRAWDYFKPH